MIGPSQVRKHDRVLATCCSAIRSNCARRRARRRAARSSSGSGGTHVACDERVAHAARACAGTAAHSIMMGLRSDGTPNHSYSAVLRCPLGDDVLASATLFRGRRGHPRASLGAAPTTCTPTSSPPAATSMKPRRDNETRRDGERRQSGGCGVLGSCSWAGSAM